MSKRAGSKRLNIARVIPVVVAILFLGVWELTADLDLIPVLFYPSPSSILQTLWQLIVNGKLAVHLGVTLARLGVGLALGMIPGVILGLFMGWSPRLRVMVDPFIAAFHPIPKTAIYPLVMIIMGIGEPSKFFTIAIATFFPILINSMAGVRQISPVHFEVAHNYGANTWKTFEHVILPGSLPMILVGMRIAFNNSLLITIALELLAARQGLGVMIWYAWETLRTQELYATLIVIALIGIAANFLLQKLTQIVVPWSIHQFQDEISSI